MKKLLFLFLFLSLKGVAQTSVTAKAYNDRLAAYTDTLFSLGQQWGTAFGGAFKSGDYSPLKVKSTSMLQFINKAIGDINNMKDVNDSKPFRMAMIGFLQFEKGMVEKAFYKFESFNATTPEDTVKAAIEKLTALSKEETLYLEKLTVTQEAYAAKNGFTIEAKKE